MPATAARRAADAGRALGAWRAAAQVVKEAYPDPTQFEAKGEYYDPKATPEAPRWFCVDVRLVRKLAAPVTLAALRPHADGALAAMALFRQSRLSVQPVSADEWAFVLGMEGAAGDGDGEKKKS